MLMAVPAADYALSLFETCRGLRSRWAIAVLSVFVLFASGSLSIARECVSNYQLYGADEAEAARYIEDNTEEHCVFLTWTEHLNPVSSLAGRDIVCGPDLWLYYHGFRTWERQNEISAFYADPENHSELLDRYHVKYIMVGPYERAGLNTDQEALDSLYPLVFTSSSESIRIYQVISSQEDEPQNE